MQEFSLPVRWLLFHLTSGQSVISGAVLLGLGLWIRIRGGRAVWQIICGTLGLIGLGCGTPSLPGWVLLTGAVWGVLSVFETRRRRLDPMPSGSSIAAPAPTAVVDATVPVTAGLQPMVSDSQQLPRVSLATGCAAIWLVMLIVVEVRQQCWWPGASLPLNIETVLVVGDSFTAGLNDDDRTWPQLLAAQRGVEVWDASQPGATLTSALKQVAALDGATGLLLLEIGGNDLLEGVPIAEFESSLAALLAMATRPDRTVAMFELPLPPGAGPYGEVQRRLAQKAGVVLIPRRFFAAILTTGGATVDGVHLTTAGHTNCARLLTELFSFKPAGRDSGGYTRVPSR